MGSDDDHVHRERSRSPRCWNDADCLRWPSAIG
uniref:Uncharacterized protein n=1 Tax=Arundo donax TaxID=35708 RepID=A0A0A8YHC3_ARUDO